MLDRDCGHNSLRRVFGGEGSSGWTLAAKTFNSFSQDQGWKLWNSFLTKTKEAVEKNNIMTAAGKVTSGWTSLTCDPIPYRKEEVFISWAAACTFYLLSPFSQSHPGLSSLLSCFQPSGWLSQLGKEADLPDTMLHLYLSTDQPVTQETGTERLTCKPCTGSGNKHDTDDLLNFL